MSLPAITITSREGAERIFASSRGKTVRNIISIGAPDGCSHPPAGFHEHPARKLRLEFDDIERDSPVYTAPRWEDVESIIQFASGVQSHLLAHCAAGVSRSAAAAWIVLCTLNEHGEEEGLLRMLKAKRPKIHPNRRMVWMADDLLGRKGNMRVAIQRMFPAWDSPQVPPRV